MPACATAHRASARRLPVGARRMSPRVQILSWYFGERLGIPVPEDLGDYAVSLGFADVGDFHALLAREYAFAHAETASTTLAQRQKDR